MLYFFYAIELKTLFFLKAYLVPENSWLTEQKLLWGRKQFTLHTEKKWKETKILNQNKSKFFSIVGNAGVDAV